MTNKTTAPIRLNTYIRDAMVEKAVQTSGIAAEHRQLIEKRADFAEKLRQHALNKAKVTDGDLRKTVQELQKDFASENPLSEFLTVSPAWSGGERANYNLQGMSIYVYMDGRRSRDSGNWNYDKTHLTDAVKKFRTIDSMLEQWPEAKDLLPQELQPGTGLAVSIADLNAICGIPTGDNEK